MAPLGLVTGDSRVADCTDCFLVYNPKTCCSTQTSVKVMAFISIVFSSVEICISFGLCYPALWSRTGQSDQRIIAYAGVVAFLGLVRIASLVNVLRSLKNQTVARTVAARGFCLCGTMSAMVLSVVFGAYLKSTSLLTDPKTPVNLYLFSIFLDILFAILYGFCVIEHYRSDVMEQNQLPSVSMRNWANKDNEKYAHNPLHQDESV